MTPIEEVSVGPRWWAVAIIYALVILTAPFWLTLAVYGWWKERRNPVPGQGWAELAASMRQPCPRCKFVTVMTPPGEPVQMCSECWMQTMDEGRAIQAKEEQR